jgi:hypothetical protein
MLDLVRCPLFLLASLLVRYLVYFSTLKLEAISTA